MTLPPTHSKADFDCFKNEHYFLLTSLYNQRSSFNWCWVVALSYISTPNPARHLDRVWLEEDHTTIYTTTTTVVTAAASVTKRLKLFMLLCFNFGSVVRTYLDQRHIFENQKRHLFFSSFWNIICFGIFGYLVSGEQDHAMLPSVYSEDDCLLNELVNILDSDPLMQATRFFFVHFLGF